MSFAEKYRTAMSGQGCPGYEPVSDNLKEHQSVRESSCREDSIFGMASIFKSSQMMKEAFMTSMSLFFRLSWRTFFRSKGTQARLTPKRFVVMSVFLPLFSLIQTLHWIGFLLDDILFKAYRDVAVKEPVFLVGVPRSGTTLRVRTLRALNAFNRTISTFFHLPLRIAIHPNDFQLGLATELRMLLVGGENFRGYTR